ncbi:MAG: ISAs1 family transposase [Oscillospiraceae bacterium]|nr:ISAs1 family transposase [Oscillospiraceae bacterium]
MSTEIHDDIGIDEWKGIAAVGMVKSSRMIDGVKPEECHYFITSLTDRDQFSQAVRMHWSLENNFHWCLDRNFNEDKCRTRMDNSSENLAVIRHISLNLYKSFTAVKLSMKAKRFRCAFDDFLCFVILNKFS